MGATTGAVTNGSNFLCWHLRRHSGVVALPGSGWMADAYGWESLFYVFGIIGCVWFVFWMLVVRESPKKDPYIGEDELQFIQKSIGTQNGGRVLEYKHPWKEIFRSPAVWAICAAHFSENWGFYTLLTQLPTFLRGIIKHLVRYSRGRNYRIPKTNRRVQGSYSYFRNKLKIVNKNESVKIIKYLFQTK